MKNVVIVGVGALGSYAAVFLRSAAHLRLVDFDRVEQKNVPVQFYGHQTVGQNKARALAQTLNLLWQVRAEVIPHKLTADNVKQLLVHADLVLDCVDNGPTRRIIQAHVRAVGLPCLHGALGADGAIGRVVWDEHFLADDSSEGQATCDGAEHVPFIADVAARLADTAQHFLRDGVRRNFMITPTALQRM